MKVVPGSRQPTREAVSSKGSVLVPSRPRMRGMRAGALVAALALGAGLTTPAPRARAQESEPGEPEVTREAPREAIELFQRAREHYRHGRYEAAANDLERALVLDPGSPTLLYNLGRVYELWGEHDRAIQTYHRYLAVIPADDVAERERTEAAIVRLRGAREYVRPDEEAYSQPIFVSQRGVDDELFWATLLTGAVITVAGGGLAVAALLAHDDATRFRIGDAGGIAARQERFDTADTLALAGDVVGAIGGATLLAAGLLWVLRERTVELYPSASTLSVELAPDPRGGGLVALRGVF